MKIFVCTALFCAVLLGFPAISRAYSDEGDVRSTLIYVQITGGCTITLSDSCIKVHSGPGMNFRVVKSLRVGSIVRVDEIIRIHGEFWYRVSHDWDRKTGPWYMRHSDTGTKWLDSSLKEPGYSDQNKIIIDLSEQTEYVYEGDKLVLETPVSTGLPGTPTRVGMYRIYRKTPSRYMKGVGYDLPGVPYVMYFGPRGEALHGAYWHNAFGTRRSHGCVNQPLDKAEWLYHWAAVGTKVVVQP